MDSLINLPQFIKVGLSFAGILAVNRFGMPLGYSILIFSVILSLWAGLGASGLRELAAGFLRPENWLLPVVIVLLLFFTEALNRSGRMKRTIDALREWLNSRKILMFGLPALIGLLPMPGGAVVSAPLVASVDEEMKLEPGHKVAINYWFRHVWEYWWPLYPGVILAMSYSGLPAALYFLVMIPLSAASIAGGYFFILKGIRDDDGEGAKNGKVAVQAVMAALGPISVLVMSSVAGSALLKVAGMSDNLASLVSMLAGLIMALIVVFSGDINSFVPAMQLFRDKNTWLMIVLVIAIQVFSGVLRHPLDGSEKTIVSLMRDEFLQAGIPIFSLIMLIPFISGAVTGVAFGFVGASFPIVFALIGADPSYAVAAAATVCAYSFGYMGMMLSPIHVCFVVTGEYFRTSLYGAYRYILGPTFVVLAAALGLSGIYYFLF